ncbi:ketopantoate reductase family protein [Thermodesulfovibrio sp.]|uniref:ketopantoate reductase family protein n=1 Tax=Thermodesulfovibrio sp. TaxID=2067987 RepID=UPI003D11653B
MEIVVFGLGALGTVFATCLKSQGHTVFGLTKEKYITHLKDRKLRIKGLFGNKEAQLDGIFTNTEQIKNKAPHLIIVSVKAYDTETAINQIKPIVGQNTLILLAQNGYGNYEVASSIVGRQKVILSRIIFGAKIVEVGTAEVTVFADDIIVGQPDKAVPEEKLIEIAKVFNEAGLPTRVSHDVYAILWDKILYNSALNPLGAILECSYGTLAEHEETRKIMNKIVEEIFNVVKIKKIKLNWKDYKEYLQHFYEKLVPPTAKHFPSMYYDIKQGKKTEIDALNGAIVKLAKECNLSVPVNETITNLIKVKEKLMMKNK